MSIDHLLKTNNNALLSVYDKTGIAEFAKGLHELGWNIIS
jgi:AICAR transformylase/IMP cyclohydrolase PurH